jgi:hypothetical protein
MTSGGRRPGKNLFDGGTGQGSYIGLVYASKGWLKCMAIFTPVNSTSDCA